MKSLDSRPRQYGFSMVEILVALSIIGILGALAYPSYKDKIQSSRRAEAKTALSDLATRMEAYYAKTNTYATATIASGNATTDILSSAATSSSLYTLSIDAAATTATTYAIKATPTGAQASDVKCAALVLNSLNVKSVTGTDPPASCW